MQTNMTDVLVHLKGRGGVRRTTWRIVEADDPDLAWNAIISASVSGSVGATKQICEPGPDGLVVKARAKVQRVIFDNGRWDDVVPYDPRLARASA